MKNAVRFTVDDKGVEHHFDADGNEVAIRVPMPMMDKLPPELQAAREAALAVLHRQEVRTDAAMHRPGYRNATREQQSKSDAVYAAYDFELGNAWRDPQRKATMDADKPRGVTAVDTGKGEVDFGAANLAEAIATASRDDTLDPSYRERAYAEYEERISNLWRVGAGKTNEQLGRVRPAPKAA